MPERCVKTLPIEAECCGSSSACALLDSTKKASLWLACALQGKNAVIARAMASICNEEWWCFGVQGGYGRLPLKLSVVQAGTPQRNFSITVASHTGVSSMG